MSYQLDCADATGKVWARLQTTVSQAPFASHVPEVCANCSFIFCQQSRTYEASLWPDAHTCRQTCTSTKTHRPWSLLLLVWGIRLPLSVSTLFLCSEISSCALVLWAPLLLSKAQETKTKGWTRSKGRGWRQLYEETALWKRLNMKVNQMKGKWQVFRCVSRLV